MFAGRDRSVYLRKTFFCLPSRETVTWVLRSHARGALESGREVGSRKEASVSCHVGVNVDDAGLRGEGAIEGGGRESSL